VAAGRISTLAGRLTAILAAFIVVATLTVTVGEYRAGRVRLVEEARADLTDRAGFAAERLNAALRDRAALVKLWAGLETAQDLAVDDIDFRLSSALAELARTLADDSHAVAARDADHVLAASEEALVDTQARPLPAAVQATLNAPAPRPIAIVPGPGPALVMASEDVISRVDGSRLGRLVVWAPLPRFLEHELPLQIGTMVVSDSLARPLFEGPDVAAAGGQAALSAIVERPTAAGTLRMRMFRPMAEITAELTTHATQLATLAALFLLLALPGTLWVVHTTTSSLGRLTAAARLLDPVHPEPLPVPSRWAPREVRVLGEAMEQMVERLEEARDELARTESLAAVGMLTKSLAHEIRTPLSVLRAGAEVLNRSANATDREREVSGMLLMEVERLARLVDDLLVFGRPSPPDLRTMDMERVASAAVDVLRPLAKEARVTLELEVEPTAARGDPDQLRQVAINLISNAIRACEGGGTVRVRTGVVAGAPFLEVEDDGTGIEPDRMEAIWRPLVTTHRSGSGLGLPIVRQLVEAHGGRIEIESVPGEGTRMRALLPLENATDA
jgi:signal transduction histidine kinase